MPDYDRLMNRLEGVIDHIVGIDQPNLTDDDRFTLVEHLTGAVIVTVMDDQKEHHAAEATGATS